MAARNQPVATGLRWTGVTWAGGVDLLAEITSKVAVNEVIAHGWDIAAATGHDYACEPELLQAARALVQAAVAQNPDGSRGLFDPSVSVPDNAPLLGRLIRLTGRDPAWRPDGKDVPGEETATAPYRWVWLRMSCITSCAYMTAPTCAGAVIAAAESRSLRLVTGPGALPAVCVAWPVARRAG
jgi:hypothetical protein